MIRAYVAPTDQPVIWIEVPAGHVDWDYAPTFHTRLGRAYIEFTTFEAEELREQIHHAVRTAELECEMPTCKGHQVAGGYCVEHGGRP